MNTEQCTPVGSVAVPLAGRTRRVRILPLRGGNASAETRGPHFRSTGKPASTTTCQKATLAETSGPHYVPRLSRARSDGAEADQLYRPMPPPASIQKPPSTKTSGHPNAPRFRRARSGGTEANKVHHSLPPSSSREEPEDGRRPILQHIVSNRGLASSLPPGVIDTSSKKSHSTPLAQDPQTKRFALAKDSKNKFNLGLVYMKQGNYEKAQDYFMRCLRTRTMLLGTKHKHVATAHEMVGDAAERMKETEKARLHYDAALNICMACLLDGSMNKVDHAKAAGGEITRNRNSNAYEMGGKSSQGRKVNVDEMLARITAKREALPPAPCPVRSRRGAGRASLVHTRSSPGRVSFVANSLQVDQLSSVKEVEEEEVEPKESLSFFKDSTRSDQKQPYGTKEDEVVEQNDLPDDASEQSLSLSSLEDSTSSDWKQAQKLSDGVVGEKNVVVPHGLSTLESKLERPRTVGLLQRGAGNRNNIVSSAQVSAQRRPAESTSALSFSLLAELSDLDNRLERRRTLRRSSSDSILNPKGKTLVNESADQSLGVRDSSKGANSEHQEKGCTREQKKEHPLFRSGKVHYDAGEYGSARTCFLGALKDQTRDGMDAGLINEMVGNCDAKSHDFDEAHMHYQEALKHIRKIAGNNNEIVARIVASVGHLYLESRDYDLATEHCEEALSLQMDLFGKNHPGVIKNSHNLIEAHDAIAKQLLEKKDHNGALCHAKRSLSIFEDICVNEPKVGSAERQLTTIKQLTLIGYLYAETNEFECGLAALSRATDMMKNIGIHLLARSNDENAQKKSLATVRCLEAFIYEKMGKYCSAIELYELALPTMFEIYKDDKEPVAKILKRMGYINARNNDNISAMSCFVQSLELLKASGAAFKKERFIPLLDAMAMIDIKQDKIDQAIKRLEEKLELIKQHHECENTLFADTLHRLGCLLSMTEKHVEAMPYHVGALRTGKRVYDEKSVEMAIRIHCLALTYDTIGSTCQALHRYEELLEMTVSEESPQILNAIARIYTKQDKLDEAVVWFKRSLHLQRHRDRSCKKNDSLEAATLNNLGIVLSRQKRFDEALQCYDTALRLNGEFGEYYHDNICCVFNKGMLFFEQGSYGEAKACFDEVLSHALGANETGSINIASLLIMIGNIHLKSCRYEDAVDYFERSLRVKKDTKLPQAETFKMLSSMGSVYFHAGSFDEAISTFERALQEHEACSLDHRGISANESEIAKVSNEIAGAYFKNRDFPMATKYFSIACRMEAASQNNIDRLKARYDMGLVLLKETNDVGYEDRLVSAIEIFQYVLPQLSSILGPNHVDVAKLLIDMGGAFLRKGDIKKSKHLLRSAKDILKNSSLPKTHMYFKELGRWIVQNKEMERGRKSAASSGLIRPQHALSA